MIESREQVTQLIVASKVRKSITWKQVAEAIGLSKEWTTAACLGQMTFDKKQAEIVGHRLVANCTLQRLTANGGTERSIDLPLV